MKTPDSIFSVAGTILLIALVTTLVLPNRQTPAVIKSGGNAFIGAIKAAMGR